MSLLLDLIRAAQTQERCECFVIGGAWWKELDRELTLYTASPDVSISRLEGTTHRAILGIPVVRAKGFADADIAELHARAPDGLPLIQVLR